MSRAIQRASELALDETTVTALRAALKTTADEVVQAIIDEVPPYANALSGHMGATIRRAVRTALGHYLDLASGNATGGDAGDAAYELGRGEVRDGRSMELIRDAGYDPVFIGDLTPGARLLEDSSGLTRALAAQIGPFFYRYAAPGQL